MVDLQQGYEAARQAAAHYEKLLNEAIQDGREIMVRLSTKVKDERVSGARVWAEWAFGDSGGVDKSE